MEQMLIDFSRDASVLDLQGRRAASFTHQLLQEYLASRLLLEASVGTRPATDFWPPARWWERNGWEVVAEIAAESCAGDVAAQHRLIAWLAEANPELAEQVWRHAGAPALSAAALAQISAHWMPLMTDLARQPQARARAAIGRALGRLGLDRRPVWVCGLMDCQTSVGSPFAVASLSCIRTVGIRACRLSRLLVIRSQTPSSRLSLTQVVAQMNVGGGALLEVLWSLSFRVGTNLIPRGKRLLVRSNCPLPLAFRCNGGADFTTDGRAMGTTARAAADENFLGGARA